MIVFCQLKHNKFGEILMCEVPEIHDGSLSCLGQYATRSMNTPHHLTHTPSSPMCEVVRCFSEVFFNPCWLNSIELFFAAKTANTVSPSFSVHLIQGAMSKSWKFPQSRLRSHSQLQAALAYHPILSTLQQVPTTKNL